MRKRQWTAMGIGSGNGDDGVTGCGSSGGEAPAETTKATEAAGTEAESTTAAGAEAAVDVKKSSGRLY